MGFIAGGFGGLRNRLIDIVLNIGKREDALIQKIKDEPVVPAPKPVNVPASGLMFSYVDYVDLRLQHLKLLKKHLRIVDLSHRKTKSQRRRGVRK